MALNDYIIIGGERITLGDNPIRITKQLSDIADTSGRQTMYTNRLSLPKSSENLNALGLPNTVNSTDDPMYKSQRAALYAAGIPVESQGTFRVLGVGNTIDGVANGPEYDFFERMDSKNLRELSNISDLDHQWTKAEIVASQAYTNTDGYKYPVIDFGGFPTGVNQVDARYMYPAVYFKWLLDQIASDEGYTFVCEVFSESFYPKMALPISGDYEHSERYKQERSFELFVSETKTYTNAFASSATDHILTRVLFNNTVYYTATQALTIPKVTANLNVIRALTGDANNTISYELAIIKNTSDIIGRVGLGIGNNLLELTNVSVVQGDTLSVAILVAATVAVAPAYATVEVETGSFFTPPIEPAIAFGDDITGESFVPDWTQKKFLINFMNQFGLIPKVDIFEKTVTFFEFQKIQNNIGKALDWSSKLVKPKNSTNDQWYVKRDGQIKNYAQTNYLRYAKDETLSNPEYGQGEIPSNNKALKQKTDLFTLDWAASESNILFSTSTHVVRIERWIGSYADDTLEEETDAEQRIIFMEDESMFLTITEDGTTFTSMGSTASIAKFIDPNYQPSLGFSGGMQAKYYSILASILQDPLLIIAEFNLSAVDFANLDHFIPVYIDRFSAFFYVNKARDFEANTITEVELIRI